MHSTFPIIGYPNVPASEHAHGQLFVPPPPLVYSETTAPLQFISSSSMFVHSDRSQLSAGAK